MTIKKIVIFCLTLFFLGAVGFYIARYEFREPMLEVYFFNLNKGRSIFLYGPDGKTILIDGGQNGEVIRELSKILPFYRRRIDVVIVTSALPKNVGGLSEVLDRYEVNKIIEPTLMGTSTALQLFQKTAKKKKVPIEKVEKGDSFAIDSMQFKVLFPDPDFKYNKSSLPELVLQVDYKDTTLVFLGDSSKTIQKSFIKDLEKIYLVEFAHGATKSRVSADLVSKLQPEVTVSAKREETLKFRFR